MRVVLRFLIAANWIGVGAGCNLWYMNRMSWYSHCEALAMRDADAKFPGGVIDNSQSYGVTVTNPEGYRFLRERAEAYRKELNDPCRVGDWACGLMVLTATGTALGLIAVFPKRPGPTPN